VRVFLDSSVLLAASASATGASREVIIRARHEGWILLKTPYVIHEVTMNLDHFPPDAIKAFDEIRPGLQVVADVLTIDRVVVFTPAKDRPILFSALAWADVLLTLDKHDFGALLGGEFYGLKVMRPGLFLAGQSGLPDP